MSKQLTAYEEERMRRFEPTKSAIIKEKMNLRYKTVNAEASPNPRAQ